VSDGELIAVTPLADEHLPGLLDLFGAGSTGCYCRFWHFRGEDNDWLARCASGANADDFARAASEGDATAQGLVAVAGDGVVGWLKLAPAPAMTKLQTRRVYRTLPHFGADRTDVLVIGCILVRPDHRRAGVARRLLSGAIDHARERGARALEAFPRVASHALRDDELQMGPAALYASLGFEVVDGPEPYPVMRLSLR
jgi:GNAT superfamily N-acetyltransferase